MEHLQAFIADCDRRTEAAKKRLAETQEELTAEVAVKANAVHQLVCTILKFQFFKSIVLQNEYRIDCCLATDADRSINLIFFSSESTFKLHVFLY